VKKNNVPTEPGRYRYHRSPGFGSKPGLCEVRQGPEGLEYKDDDVGEWGWKPLSSFWNIHDWLWSDKLGEEK
jgi:hypothetical protein